MGAVKKSTARTYTREQHQARALWSRYRMRPEQYTAMLVQQGGVCAICRLAPVPGGRALAVDHDHTCCPGPRTCGECVRELLCIRCNTFVAAFEDEDAVARFTAYVDRWRR